MDRRKLPTINRPAGPRHGRDRGEKREGQELKRSDREREKGGGKGGAQTFWRIGYHDHSRWMREGEGRAEGGERVEEGRERTGVKKSGRIGRVRNGAKEGKEMDNNTKENKNREKKKKKKSIAYHGARAMK